MLLRALCVSVVKIHFFVNNSICTAVIMGKTMGDLQKENVSDLVQAARSGNRGSLETLVNLFHGDIFRLVYYRTRSRMEAEDLTQDTFLEMSRSLASLRDPSRFKAWLYRIALNKVRDFHRRKKLRSFLFRVDAEGDVEAEDNSGNPMEHASAKEFWREFHNMTRIMSPGEREVFILRYVDQLGIREIAEAMKKNESTVKTHLYRALKKFKKAPGFHALLKENTP